MAAITPHLGIQNHGHEEEERRARAAEGLGGLDGMRTGAPPLAVMHANLSRLHWSRKVLIDAVRGQQVRVQRVGNNYKFVLDKPIDKNVIPWMPAAVKQMRSWSFFGVAAKMDCPTWDLPAGALAIGGACPGVTPGQTVVPDDRRRELLQGGKLPILGEPVRLRDTTCNLCYASGGQYITPIPQLGEIVRYAWCVQMLSARGGKTRQQWIDTMVAAVLRQRHTVTKQGVFPIRVHSSGDFYDPSYASAWIEIVNQVSAIEPRIVFWAPTRTWASRLWAGFWEAAYRPLDAAASTDWADVPAIRSPRNFVVRLSAFHTNDKALPSLVPGRMPQGTTACYKDTIVGLPSPELARAANMKVNPDEDRFAWQCGTYAIKDDAHSCTVARGPDGEVGCRACWVETDLAVNFAVH